MNNGSLVLSANGEILDIEAIWFERGAIWVRAHTASVMHHYKPGTPTLFEVYGRDGTLVQAPKLGVFDTGEVWPGDAWTITLSLKSQQLVSDLEGLTKQVG